MKKPCTMLAVMLAGTIFFASCLDPYIDTTKTPVSGDYVVGNLNQAPGSVTAVTITAKSGKSPGTVSNIRYANNTAIPQEAGTYAVTFDVAAASGWNAAAGLAAGNLVVATVGIQTPVADDYVVGNLNQAPGSVTAVTITAKSGKSPGVISNIRYANSTTIPQAIGTYAVTFDVAAASGWNAVTGLSAGVLTVSAVVNGIQVTNPNNVADSAFNASITAVASAFTMFAESEEYIAAYIPVIKSNVQEIRIIPASASAEKFSWVKSGTKYIVSIQVGAEDTDIALGFYDFVNENELTPVPERCTCSPKQHYEGESCCPGGVEAKNCDCTFIPHIPPAPAECEHNGKEHLPGDHRQLPEGENCTCVNIDGVKSAYALLPVTNREGMPSEEFDAVVAIINEKITEFEDEEHTYLSKLISNIAEIKVTSENGNSQYNSTTKVITVRAGDLEDVEDSLTNALVSAVNAVLGRHLGHDTMDSIRLAKHEDKPTMTYALLTNVVTVHRKPV